METEYEKNLFLADFWLSDIFGDVQQALAEIEPQPLIGLNEMPECLEGKQRYYNISWLSLSILFTLMCERKGQRDLHYAVQMLISHRACQ